MTKNHVRVSEKQLFNLVCPNPKLIEPVFPEPAEVNGKVKKWTGRQLLSTILPEKVNVYIRTDNYDEAKSEEVNKNNNAVIEIKNGKIYSGTFSKDVYQAQSKGIIHQVFNEYGPEETRHLFDNTQQLVCNWLVLDGFSVGISDMVLSQETTQSFKKIIHDMKVSVYNTIADIHKGKFENKSTKNTKEYFEETVNTKLNGALNSIGKKGNSEIDEDNNRLINMIKSKSKGQMINVAQMMGCVGQQNVDGKRIPYGFDDRTLPHYTKYDEGPECRGFIQNSFIGGLTPQEFYFAAMGGREGLIDTAVQSVTGETPIIIIENGKSKYVKIGDWIDSYIESYKDDVKHYTERRMELLDLKTPIYIPTTDYNGNVTWGAVTAMTRHDPGTELYQIRTLGGKTVIVTESKSLLTWQPELNQFLEVPTPEIKLGDFVPVTAALSTPPVTISEVDMSVYFPKDKYVHGTDFNTAIKMMKTAMDGNFHIPSGWWNQNNGSAFTLPYDKKAKLQRVVARSNTDNVKDGCIYPFHATREHSHFPSKIALNKANGTFIGLYIAEGCCSEKSGTVSITNIDSKVQQFVREWFDSHGITHKTVSKINKIGGTTSSVIGHSVMLARFLDVFVGHGAHNKFVPDVAFVSPEDFIIGILNGYIAGDGTVGKNCIEATSTSQRLIEGVSMLCTRLGVFGKVFTHQATSNNLGTENIRLKHRIAIRAQWAKLLASKLDVMIDYKNENLKNLKCKNVHRNFQMHNDVVLDKIVEIKLIDIKKHPKVYDLTIPSTLNFGLANGLQVRDTSETGYIQRKLVKAMEDTKVYYDLTVRNASGNIIQFLYGEDGADATKVESQTLPYISMSVEEIISKFAITDKAEEFKNILEQDILKSIGKDKGFPQLMANHIEQLFEDREHVIVKMFNGQQEDKVYYPVAFQRILLIASNMQNKHTKQVVLDLDPRYVLAEIEKLCTEIVVSKHQAGNKLFQILVRLNLSPKVLITKYKISKATFDYVIQQIKYRFYESLVHPSEMVGVIAAQSIGEPATQLSIIGSDKVVVLYKGTVFKGPIGGLIDNILSKQPKRIVKLGHGSVVLDTTGPDGSDDDIRIIGVSNDEKTSWKRITQVSRHPANGNLVKVTTKSGRTATCTLSHSFLKRTENGIEPVKGSDLKIGDRMPIAKFTPTSPLEIKEIAIGDKTYTLTSDLGWFFGTFIADGHASTSSITITKIITEYQDELKRIGETVFNLQMRQSHKKKGDEPVMLHGCDMSQYEGTMNHFNSRVLADYLCKEFGTGAANKKIPGWVFGAPLDFVKGLIRGYVDGDGNVSGTAGKGMIRTASISESLTNDFILLLTRVGIYASKCVEKHVKEAGRNDLHTAQISRKYAKTFRDEIGLVVKHKADALEEIIDYNERDDAHNHQEYIDKIPAMGNALAAIGKGLELPGQSRLYKRFQNKESIGRNTLASYETVFKAAYEQKIREIEEMYTDYNTRISTLKTLLESPVDMRNNHALPTEAGQCIAYLGRGTTDNGLGSPEGSGNMSQWARLTSIGRTTLEKFVSHFESANEDQHKTSHAYIIKCVDPAMAAVRTALEADVIWDEITDLEIIKDNGDLVYDFTVPGNDSFMVNCGVLVHNTLNTFHLAGVSAASKAVRGVPRLNELLSVSKNIKAPIMKVSFRDDIGTNKKQAIQTMNEICTIRFRDIVIGSRVYYDPDDFNTNIAEDKDFVSLYKEFSTSTIPSTPWLLRLEFDRAKMHDYSLDMITLHHILDNFYDERICCVFSDDNSNQLIMRIKLVEENTKDGDRDDLLTDLKALEHNILENVVIRGVKNIERASVTELSNTRYNPVSKSFDKVSECIIYTDGTNLKDILAMNVVDSVRTMTNDVVEVYDVLGVEAARQVLYNEIVDVLDNIHVNYRHIALLVDVMTNKGSILSVNRHGINRGDIGPLAKCSFEETTDKLIKAGIFAEYDKINGVAANVMLGQVAPAGTGDVEIIIDESKLTHKVVLDAIDEEDLDEMKAIACSEENLSIHVNIPQQRNVPVARKTHNVIEVK
jgi:DNA-directed RNA polymerase beta' subunit